MTCFICLFSVIVLHTRSLNCGWRRELWLKVNCHKWTMKESDVSWPITTGYLNPQDHSVLNYSLHQSYNNYKRHFQEYFQDIFKSVMQPQHVIKEGFLMWLVWLSCLTQYPPRPVRVVSVWTPRRKGRWKYLAKTNSNNPCIRWDVT